MSLHKCVLPLEFGASHSRSAEMAHLKLSASVGPRVLLPGSRLPDYAPRSRWESAPMGDSALPGNSAGAKNAPWANIYRITKSRRRSESSLPSTEKSSQQPTPSGTATSDAAIRMYNTESRTPYKRRNSPSTPPVEEDHKILLQPHVYNTSEQNVVQDILPSSRTTATSILSDESAGITSINETSTCFR